MDLSLQQEDGTVTINGSAGYDSGVQYHGDDGLPTFGPLKAGHGSRRIQALVIAVQGVICDGLNSCGHFRLILRLGKGIEYDHM